MDQATSHSIKESFDSLRDTLEAIRATITRLEITVAVTQQQQLLVAQALTTIGEANLPARMLLAEHKVISIDDDLVDVSSRLSKHADRLDTIERSQSAFSGGRAVVAYLVSLILSIAALAAAALRG